MKDKEKQIEICENCKIKDTCSNRILTHMEKCKVEDCEYYCEVIDGEKEIEEMAKVIESTEFDWYVQEGTSLQDWVKMHAQALYNAGYRNVKDKVVLSKEEYIDNLTQYYGVSEIKDMVRKETAREILNEFGKCKYEKEWYAVWVTLIKKYGIEE